MGEGLFGRTVEALPRLLGYVIKLICMPTKELREAMAGEGDQKIPCWAHHRHIHSRMNTKEKMVPLLNGVGDLV